MEKRQENQGRWKIWNFVLVLIFGLILGMGIWGNLGQTLVGDDYMFHIARMQGASYALSSGQIIAQVDPDALGGFGYAYNIFYGPLVTYVAAGVQFLVQNWTVAINLVLILILIMSGMTMCYALTKISKSPALGAMAGIFYMAAPYLLTDLYDRMAIGEAMAFIAAPILLLGLYQLTANERNASRSIAIAAALLIFSHSLSAMLFALMGGIYVLINIDKVFRPRKIWRMVLAVIVALGLTAVFTLPLADAKLRGADYGIFDTSYVDNYFGASGDGVNAHRIKWEELFLSERGESWPYLSLGFVAIFALAGFWLVRKRIENKDERRFVTSLYIIAIIAILATTTLVDWNYAPSIMLQMQFPWRFLEITTVVLSAVAAYVSYTVLRGLAEDKQKVLVAFVGILAIVPVTGFYLPSERNVLSESLSEQEEIEAGSLGWQVEYAPKQLLCSIDDPEEKEQDYKCSLNKISGVLSKRGDKVRILSGEVKLGSVSRDGNKFAFSVKNIGQKEAEIELPLIYYPGYEAWLDGEELEVGVSESMGLVMIIAPAGAEGNINVFYGMSTATYVGAIVSSITAGVGLVWVVITGLLDARARKKNAEVARLMETVREAIGDEELLGFSDIKKSEEVDEPNSEKSKIKAQKKNEMVPEPKKATKQKTNISAKKKTTPAKTTGRRTTKAKKDSTKEDNINEKTKDKITRVKASSRPRKDPE